MADQATQREQALADLVATHLGIDLFRFSGTTIEALLRRVADPARLADAGTLRAIEASLAIGETAFLRRPCHFAVLPQLVRSMLAASGAHPLRIWSAGCSTGEEAYSLAAVLRSEAPHEVRVLATDVREEAIAQARLGRYRLWSLRGLDPHNLTTWLDRHDDRLEVRPDLRRCIDFQVHNLVHDPYPASFDIVFCRNVLLYFRVEVAAAVLTRLADSVRPGGVLFLGDFDPVPLPDGPWQEEALGEATFYRRAFDPPPKEPDDDACVVRAPSTVSLGTPAQRLAAGLLRARRLSDEMAVDEGLALLDELTIAFPLELEPHVLFALLAREGGAAQRALEAARRACFLAPSEPVTHYLMAACLCEVGEAQRARSHLHTAAVLLSATADRTSPLRYGEGLTANQLQRMIPHTGIARMLFPVLHCAEPV